jgi:hypothetical protein
MRLSHPMRFTCEFFVSRDDSGVNPLAVSQSIPRIGPACFRFFDETLKKPSDGYRLKIKEGKSERGRVGKREK